MPTEDHLMQLSATRRGALLSLSALALAISGCGGSDDPEPDSKAEITLLVYIMGTNLESDDNSASGNIKEMQSVAPSDKVNVVLTTGAADKDGWRTVQRKRIMGAQIEQIADLGQIDMGSQATLQDFISWGMQTYPAKRTMLVLWDHGGGPNHGIGPDPFSENALSMDKIRGALDATTKAAGQKFALISFDACLMATVEVAQALAPYADYMVASEELEPGTGQNWAALLQHLTTKPTDATQAFGRTMVDAYISKQYAEDPRSGCTLSLTDLSKMGELTAALAQVSGSLRDQLIAEPAQTWISIAQGRSKAYIFGSEMLSPGGLELADMNLFTSLNIPLPDDQRSRLTAALTSAVVHEKHSAALSGDLAGLSFYLPQRVAQTGADTQTYGTLSFLPEAQRSLIARCQSVGEDTSLLPLPVVGAIDWGTGSRFAPSRMEASLQTPFRDLVEQDFSFLQGSAGEIRAFKPLRDGTGESLVDADFMQGWLRLMDADGSPVYFSAIPDGLRFAEDDPETFLVPISAREIGQADASDGFLVVTDAGQPGELRVTGYLPQSLTQGSAAAPRSTVLPENSEVQPRWMLPGVTGQSIPEWVTASQDIPFIPLQQNQAFPRGPLVQIELGLYPRMGVVDVRGWLSLNQPPR